MAENTIEVYVLDVRIPKQDNKKVTVHHEMTLGSDASCDIRITDNGLAPLQGRFRLQNGVLTFTNLGPEDSIKVGSQKCGHGRMYFVDKGDKCIIEKVKLIVRKDKVKAPDSSSAALDELEDEDSEDLRMGGMAQETHASSIQEEATQTNAPTDDDQEEAENEYEIVEEVVYVDEDGNEVANPKKPSFFDNLREILKKKERNKAPTKKRVASGFQAGQKLKSKKKIMAPTAGVLSRFAGIFYNILFFLCLYFLGLPILEEVLKVKITPFLDKPFEFFSPYIKKIPEKAPELLKPIPSIDALWAQMKTYAGDKEAYRYVFGFLAYNTLFHLIFGLGLGQFMVGLKARGKFIIVRLLAPIRMLLGILLGPLLIFDLPILAHKASLKEVLTFTRIESRAQVLTAFNSLIFLPVATLIGINYQLVPSLIKGITTLNSKEVVVEKSKGHINDTPFEYKNIALNTAAETFLDPAIYFVPSIHKVENNYHPKLTVATNKNNSQLVLYRKKTFLKIKEILKIVKKDPFLYFTHPELYKTLQTKGNKNYSQVINVLFEVMSLNFYDPIKVVRELGIFLNPYNELKILFQKKLGTDRLSEVQLIKGVGDPILQINFHNPNAQAESRKYLLRYNKDRIDMIEIHYTQQMESFAQETVKNLFYRARPFEGDYKDVINESIKKPDLKKRGLVVLDIFNKVLNKKELNPAEIKIIIDFYSKLSAYGLKTESEEFQSIILENFEDLDKLLLRLKKRNKDESLGEVRLTLNRIQKALFDRDEKFFNLNK